MIGSNSLFGPGFIKQVTSLTVSSMMARYRKTWWGFLWVLLHPLITFIAQLVVFHFIIGIKVDDYPLYLVTGLLPWIFIQQSIDMTTAQLIYQGGLLKSIPLHPLALIVATVVNNFINFLFAFVVLFLGMVFFFPFSLNGLLFSPLALASLFLGVISFCSLFSLLNVFYRDLKFVLSFVLSVLFFFTPIFYSVNHIPIWLKPIIFSNPFFYLIRPIRSSLYAFSTSQFLIDLGLALFVGLATGALSIQLWRSKKNEAYLLI